MWPGRRYWIWNVRIWLVLAFGVVLLLVLGGPSGGGLARDLFGLWLGTVFWVIVSFALWLVLRAGRVEAHTVSERLWFSVWVLLGLVTAVAALALGSLLLLPAAAVAGLLAYRRGMRRSVYGLMSGLGALLILSMPWQSAHESLACKQIAPNTVECPNHVGFAWATAFGLLLLISGVVAQVWRPNGSQGHTG